MQTANPDFYGGERVSLSLGLGLTGQKGIYKDHGLGIEATIPLYQDLNGPQLARDYALTVAYRKSF